MGRKWDFSEFVPRNLGQGDVVNDHALHFAVQCGSKVSIKYIYIYVSMCVCVCVCVCVYIERE